MDVLREKPSVPAVLRDAYAAWDWQLAYQYGPEIATYRLAHPRGEVRFLKLAEAAHAQLLMDEIPRMRWAHAHLPVPEILEFSTNDNDQIYWLMTRAGPGVDATNATFRNRPLRVLELLAEGLRRFHQAPFEDCPFDFQLDQALSLVERRVESGAIDPERDFHPEHQHLSVNDALRQLQRDRPQNEDLVVCHGDFCFPNILIDGDRVAGFVDLGELGVADRWWDLAVATWSTTWNVGRGYEDAFLNAYEIEPDADRIAYYRLLYDLVS